jgi:hypothetical protein
MGCAPHKADWYIAAELWARTGVMGEVDEKDRRCCDGSDLGRLFARSRFLDVELGERRRVRGSK